jgi:hypothetical protein
LPFANRKVGYHAVWFNLQSVIVRQGANLRPCRGLAEIERPDRLCSKHDVLKHRHLVSQREMLMHHADSGRQRRMRIARRQRSAKGLDVPFVGGVMAEQDVHQRGLARAVFTQQRNHLAAHERQRNRIVCHQ